jgi:hypothetical protein
MCAVTVRIWSVTWKNRLPHGDADHGGESVEWDRRRRSAVRNRSAAD